MTKGFTLIETLVAIAILGILMVAPFYAVEQSVSAADDARDELTGSFLAQEGVEYVRSVRDDNYLYLRANPTSTQSWLYGIDGTTSNGITSPNCFSPSYQCSVDPTTNLVVQYAANATVPTLYINNATNLYTQQSSGGTATNFTRTVQLVTISNSEVEAIVTVKWATRGRPYTTAITAYFDNWQII